MADTKISAFPPRTVFTGSEEFTTLFGGVNYRSPVAAIGTFTNDGTGAVTRTVVDRLSDTVHLLDFIPVAEHAAIYAGTSTYDVSTALQNAINSVATNVTIAGSVPLTGAPEIILPYGKVHFDSTIEIKRTIILKGHGIGEAGGAGSLLEFAQDTHGIVIHVGVSFDIDKGAGQWASGSTYPAGPALQYGHYVWNGAHPTAKIYELITSGPGTSTVGPTPANSNTVLADGYQWLLLDVDMGAGAASTFRDFKIKQIGPSTIGHGIWPRARVTIENVAIDNFAQDGLHIDATAADQFSGTVTGNTDCSYFANIRVVNCGGDGVHIDGADANAMIFLKMNVTDNVGCGVWDSSYFGNTHIMHHARGNGIRAKTHYLGSTYAVINTTLANTTEPGPGTANNAAWEYINAGNWALRTWSNLDLVPYEYGYAYAGISNNSQGAFIGMYMESGQPKMYIVAPWISIGSQLVTSHSTGLRLASTTGGTLVQRSARFDSAAAATPLYTTNINRQNDETLTLLTTGDHSDGLGLLNWNDASNCWITQHARDALRIPVRYTTDLSTAVVCGRSTPIGGGQIMFSRGIFLGDALAPGSTNNARLMTNGTAAPTTGTWAVGDIVFNRAPAIGEPLAWICVTDSEPGPMVWAATAPLVAA